MLCSVVFDWGIVSFSNTFLLKYNILRIRSIETYTFAIEKHQYSYTPLLLKFRSFGSNNENIVKNLNSP